MGIPEPGAIQFWKARRLTLPFRLVTLPFALGLAIALAVDGAARYVGGPVIPVSILPFNITPEIGALGIRRPFYGVGIPAVRLGALFDTDPAVAANGLAVEFPTTFSRIWHVAAFASVIFHADLQTVNRDTFEIALLDGASRSQRLRSVAVPHFVSLVVFVTLIRLTNAYRAFEEAVGCSSESRRVTLRHLRYDHLQPDDGGIA